MPYRVDVTPAAARDLRKLDPTIRKQVMSDISELANEARPRGVEKLVTHEKLYRIYVGPGKNYRAVYQIRDEVLLVLIVKVRNWKDIYRRLK